MLSRLHAVDKAKVFNAYICSIFTRENFSNLAHLRNLVQASCSTSSIDGVVISEDAAFEIDLCKACGPDDIPGRLLKEEAPWLAEPLIQLYNLSLQSGVLPRDWRRANVTPVFKKGDKHSPSNYRPISLTSLVVKCLERLVHTRILEFLEANNKLSSHQHGFRKGHSCQTQLLGMIHELARSLDNRLSTHVIYLELDCMGIRGNILRWIEVFLSDREQL